MKLVLTSLVAGALMFASVQAAMPSPTTARQVVRATIWPNLAITFSPKTFKHGTVLIKVSNRTSQTHQFSLNGFVSARIKPYGAGAVTVTLPRRATYQATLADCGYPSFCVGGNVDTGPTGDVKVT